MIFDSILIANRGEIARRIIAAARKLYLRTIAIYSDADAAAAHVAEADTAIRIGEARPEASYLNINAIIEAAKYAGASAIHPGYGFLSENPIFAEAVIAQRIAWIGPSPEVIRSVGEKVRARELFAKTGFPVNAGGRVATSQDAVDIARRVGLPVIVKPAAGGGGIGMKIVRDASELWTTCERTSAQAQRLFQDGSLLVERFFENARHVEIQILGLANGRVVVLGDRECSVQRRFQKIAEEAPAPGLSASMRQRMYQDAKRAAEAIGYRNAGTIECLVSGDEFVFLEVNARLQVEHPVTELVTGLDIVAEQIRIAASDEPSFDPAAIAATGHAIEFRIYAEDPVRFFPSPGKITKWVVPEMDGIRIDAGYRCGDTVSPYYDPLIAKLCAWGTDREAALARMREAVDAFHVEGIKTNLPFLAELLNETAFHAGNYHTGLVGMMRAGNGCVL